MITAADIRAEHTATILSMTPKQRRVLERILEAKRMGAIGPLSGRTMDERLNAVCSREASARNAAQPEPVTITVHKLTEPRLVARAEAEALFQPRSIEIG